MKNQQIQKLQIDGINHPDIYPKYILGWQGWGDSNSQLSVLETEALPIKLHP